MKPESMNIVNRILVAVLALLGFSACGENGGGYVEYGTPYAIYRINGTVTDTDNVPVKGIKVDVIVKSDSGDEEHVLDTKYTDENGAFTSDAGLFNEVSFSDIDGEDNGGSFRPVRLNVKDMKKTQIEMGDGHWYNGSFAYTADVRLEKE